jgi:hypothetical protein
VDKSSFSCEFRVNGHPVATFPVGEAFLVMLGTHLDRSAGSSWLRRVVFGPDTTLAVGEPAAEPRLKNKVLFGRHLRFADRVTITVASPEAPPSFLHNEVAGSWLRISGDLEVQRDVQQATGLCYLNVALENRADCLDARISFRHISRGGHGESLYEGERRVRFLVMDFRPSIARSKREEGGASPR